MLFDHFELVMLVLECLMEQGEEWHWRSRKQQLGIEIASLKI